MSRELPQRNSFHFWTKIQGYVPKVIPLIPLLGIIYFIIRLWRFANVQPSIGDEGAYLFKGYIFARGDYYPFQEYAFWTNKGPLSFQIPGYIQYWFGTSLRVGRYFSSFLGVLTLIGVWITANRLAGKYWAALAVWALALSTSQAIVFVLGISQALVACMMSWMLVLVLGRDRPVWQLLLGSCLSVLIILTRQNMLPVPFLLVAYIFWTHNAKVGWWAFGTAVSTFTLFYFQYGPELLKLWSVWILKILPSEPGVQKDLIAFEFVSPISRLLSSSGIVRKDFFVVVGSMAALVLWQPKRYWRDIIQYKTTVFLAVSYFILFAMHYWAAIFNEYCVWCLASYHAFFFVPGLLFVILFFSNYRIETRAQGIFLSVFLVCVAGILGFDYYLRWGEWLLNNVTIPLLSRLVRGDGIYTVPLSDVLTYQFFIPFEFQAYIASLIGGITLGIFFVSGAGLLYRFEFFHKSKSVYPRTRLLLATFLCCTFLVFLWAREPSSTRNTCRKNYLANYEKVAKELSDVIPPNVLLYWRGHGNHLGMMLYLTDVRFFPPQIHAGGGYFTSITDTNYLLKHGLYNKTIDDEWREKADYHIVWDVYYKNEGRAIFDSPQYERVPFDMGELAQCEEKLMVFKKR